VRDSAFAVVVAAELTVFRWCAQMMEARQQETEQAVNRSSQQSLQLLQETDERMRDKERETQRDKEREIGKHNAADNSFAKHIETDVVQLHIAEREEQNRTMIQHRERMVTRILAQVRSDVENELSSLRSTVREVEREVKSAQQRLIESESHTSEAVAALTSKISGIASQWQLSQQLQQQQQQLQQQAQTQQRLSGTSISLRS